MSTQDFNKNSNPFDLASGANGLDWKTSFEAFPPISDAPASPLAGSSLPTERTFGGKNTTIHYLSNSVEVAGFICNEVPYVIPDKRAEVVEKYYKQLLDELKISETGDYMLPKYTVKSSKEGILKFEKSSAARNAFVTFTAKKGGASNATHSKVVALIAEKHTNPDTKELNEAAALEEYNNYMEQHKGYYKVSNTMRNPQYLVLAPIDQSTGTEFITHFGTDVLGEGVFENQEAYCKIVRPKTFLQSLANNFAGTDILPAVSVNTTINNKVVRAYNLVPVITSKDGINKVSLAYTSIGSDAEQLRAKGLAFTSSRNIVDALVKVGGKASFAFLHDSRDKASEKIKKDVINPKSYEEKANLSAILREEFAGFDANYVKLVAPPRKTSDDVVNPEYATYIENRKLTYKDNKNALAAMNVPESTFKRILDRKLASKANKYVTRDILTQSWSSFTADQLMF